MNTDFVRLAGCLIKNEFGDLLLIHRNVGTFKQWELPGGKSHIYELSETTAERELKEELNLIVKAGDLITVNFFSENGVDYAYYIHSGQILSGIIEIMEMDKFDNYGYFSKKHIYNNIESLSINVKMLLESINKKEP